MENLVGMKRLLEDRQDSRVFKKICYYQQQDSIEGGEFQEEYEEILEEVQEEEPAEKELMFADSEEEEEEYDPQEFEEPEELMEEEYEKEPEYEEKAEEEPQEYDPEEEYNLEELEEEYQEDEELEENLEEEDDDEIPTVSTTPERDIFDDYTLMKDLGEGGFATVKLCRHNVSGELFACKIMSKENLYSVHCFTEEVTILRHLSPCSGVIGLKDVYENNDWMYLVMELCPNGDLLKYMQKGIDLPSESELAIKFKGLIETLCYCHEKGVVHRDIKPDNILLTESNNFVLADFGLATRISNGKSLWEYVGTKHCVAPEMLDGSYTEKIDVWSAGILLCYLLTNKVPFQGSTDLKIREAIRQNEIDFDDGRWTNVSSLAKDLIARMLTKDQLKRPGAKEVLRHPWFQRVFPTLETKPSSCSNPVKAKLQGCNPRPKHACMAAKQPPCCYAV